jgi:hypothetical protein
MAAFSAPDKPTTLENGNDIERYAVAISSIDPRPAIGEFRIQVDRPAP